MMVATQMLESMISSSVPTRTEVSDITTLVYQGADAIMLSVETAAGKHSIEPASTVSRIREEVERDVTYRTVVSTQRPDPGVDGRPIPLRARRGKLLRCSTCP